jgi:hypothetical protein
LASASTSYNGVFYDDKGFPNLTILFPPFLEVATVLKNFPRNYSTVRYDNVNYTPFSTRQETLFALLTYIYTGVDE